MKTKRIILSVAAASVMPLLMNAQDIHFSQLNQTPLLLNPANTALSHDFMAIVNYKDQWRSISPNPFKTFNVCTDVGFMKNSNGSHLGFGLNVFSDKAGDGSMGTTTGQAHLSGVLATDENNLVSVGLYGGFGQRSIKTEKLFWDSQFINGTFDASAPSNEPNAFPTRTYADIGAGAAWFFGKGHSTISSNDALNFTLGFAVQHINRPVYSFYGNNDAKLPMKYVAHGDADIGLKNYSLVLQPAYAVMIQGGHHEINTGLMVKYLFQEASHYTGRKKPGAFVLGGYYRFGDAINVVTAYEMNTMRIGFSYDINLSGLTVASNARGGFEVSLRFMMTDSGFNKHKEFFN